jgi:ubiquinone/menaquinone biosynthesis C-methylase UbiE
MQHTHQVGQLFDAKALSWNAKYNPAGPLAFRVSVFSSLLARQVKPGSAVLDFGGGTGAIASALALRGFRMTVCDLSKQMIASGRQLHSGQAIDWRVLDRDWKHLPFADASFDAVIASSVFEYLDDTDRVLSECRRILQPGGKLIFSVPDPAHRTRKIERFLRPLALLLLKIPFVARLPKIGNYLTYLKISRARFFESQWREKASRAGLRPVTVELDQAQRAANQALMYLAFTF